jgi:molecular chaperone GrpE (heat shock protein)
MAKRTKKSANDLEQEVLTETIENNQKVEDQTDWKDLYLRLYADFDNYKKRALKDREDSTVQVKINLISSILDLDNDLSLAKKNLPESEGLNLIFQKLNNFLKSQGIEEIQTDTYDSDVHEVISVLETGESKIIDVISKGYKIGEKPFRYPKIILSK